MRLGIDLDNTIVSYEGLFHRVALERGAIPADLPTDKSAVRDYLRKQGREDLWTELQGIVYGPRMSEAAAHAGVIDFLRLCRAAGVPVFIISHKTRVPCRGSAHDLHVAAMSWLEQQGFFNEDGAGLDRDSVFLELTREAKLARIASSRCTHFIDDLPEFLLEPGFPPGVARILFDPHRAHGPTESWDLLRHWNEAKRLLNIAPRAPGVDSAGSHRRSRAARPQTPGIDVREQDAVAAFLARCGFPEFEGLEAIPGGANNRVFKARANGRSWAVKAYFHTKEDTRDRFAAERAFYAWACRHAPGRVPEPLGWDRERRLGLFEHIEGRKLAPGEVDATAIDSAIDFVERLNAGRRFPEAQALPVAAEACFSLSDHMERIGFRVRRLRQIPALTEIDQAALDWVEEDLIPAWQRAEARIKAVGTTRFSEPLNAEERCLSPSDFGFHNALRAADGRLVFFDFEYAGWDDPAKLVCDFFCQPSIPANLAFWPRMAEAAQRLFPIREGLAERAALLLPAYQVKWCAILLNEFLPAHQSRRRFALRDASDSERKAAQLEKARAMLARPPRPYAVRIDSHLP